MGPRPELELGKRSVRRRYGCVSLRKKRRDYGESGNAGRCGAGKQEPRCLTVVVEQRVCLSRIFCFGDSHEELKRAVPERPLFLCAAVCIVYEYRCMVS